MNPITVTILLDRFHPIQNTCFVWNLPGHGQRQYGNTSNKKKHSNIAVQRKSSKVTWSRAQCFLWRKYLWSHNFIMYHSKEREITTAVRSQGRSLFYSGLNYIENKLIRSLQRKWFSNSWYSQRFLRAFPGEVVIYGISHEGGERVGALCGLVAGGAGRTQRWQAGVFWVTSGGASPGEKKWDWYRVFLPLLRYCGCGGDGGGAALGVVMKATGIGLSRDDHWGELMCILIRKLLWQYKERLWWSVEDSHRQWSVV